MARTGAHATSFEIAQYLGPRFGGFPIAVAIFNRLKFVFFLNDPATTELYTLSLHDALPIHHLPPYEIARLGIGYVPEGQGIFGTLTVDENLRVAALAEDAASGRRLKQILDLFPDLDRFRHARAATLSGGQKQMLSIARAFVNPNRLLLIDEPSKGLAPIIVLHLVDALRAMKQHATVLLVEQNFAMASALADDHELKKKYLGI